MNSNTALVIIIALGLTAAVLFSGTPDLHDALMYRLRACF